MKAVVRAALAGDRDAAVEFFRKEFALDYLLRRMMAGSVAASHATQVAVMDGVTMGGGVGLAMHGPFRVATERCDLAHASTPETPLSDTAACLQGKWSAAVWA